MKIGVDIRGYSEDRKYGSFVLAFTKELTNTDFENTYVIYTNIPRDFGVNAEVIVTESKKGSFLHQKSFKNLVENSKLGFFLCFDSLIPKNLGVEYYTIVEKLTEIFFPSSGYLEKVLYQKKLKHTLENAKKVLVFESNTAKELNERLDIHEEKIAILPGFFASKITHTGVSEIKLDVKARHNLSGEYFLYDAGNTTHANFERLLETMQKLVKSGKKIHLLVISESTSGDVELRQKVLEYNIKDTILFLDNLKENEKYFYYTQSSALLYPSIYESFCFDFITALSYGVPIIANDLKSTKEIFAEAIHYANFLAPHRANERIQLFLESGEKRRDYGEIFTDMSAGNCIKIFQKIAGITPLEKE